MFGCKKIRTLICFVCLSFLLGVSHAYADSTSTDAVYDGSSWTGTTSGTPGPNQNNTFNSSAPGNPALTVDSSGGVNAKLYHDGSTPSNLTNTINGDFILNGGFADLYNDNPGNLTNTINGDFILNGGIGNFFSGSTLGLTNIITGCMTVNGGTSFVYLYNFATGHLTNTITGGITVSGGGVAWLSNTGTGNVANIISGGITLSGNYLDIGNYGAGSITNTLDTVSLSGGDFYIGGGGNTTTIDTMNWSGGTLDPVYSNNSFGNTAITNLNITGPVNLNLYDNNTSASMTSAPSAGPYTLFTVSNFTGDPTQIALVNNSSTFEIHPNDTSYPSGIVLTNDGKVHVNLVPVATTTDSTTVSAVVDAVHNNSISNISNAGIAEAVEDTVEGTEQTFISTAASMKKTRERMQKAFRENSKDPFEAAVTAFSESDNPYIKFKGDYRVWMAPYALRVRNSGLSGSSGFTEKAYGLLLGGSHYLKSIETNLTAVMGVGMSKTQQDAKANSNTTGKSLILGLIATKQVWDKKIDIISSLYGFGTQHNQFRQGNPSPSQSYLAFSRFKTGSVSWQNEAGYVMKLKGDYSLRPNIGVQVLGNYRSSFTEQNAGNFAQSYRKQFKGSGEAYTGIGLRKKWTADRYEGKVTLSYSIGRLSGNGKSTTNVYVNSAPQGVAFTSSKPGLTVQYINFYGSVLDKESNWKIVPGGSYSFQKGQYALSGTVKLEYRW